MRLLLTRPEADSGPLAEHLRERAIETLTEPMLTIELLADAALDLGGAQAVLVTSANGARAVAEATDRRDVAVYAVGDASAACAVELGFSQVVSAAGDVETLAAKVITELDPAAGPLVHAAGSDVAGDLGGRLGAAGFEVRRAVLYRARAAEHLSERCVSALRDGTLDGALFFSPRTSATFVRLVAEAALETCCARIDALCLSQAVADTAAALTWRRVRVALKPDQASLLALLDDPELMHDE